MNMNPSFSTLWMQRRRPTLFLLSMAYLMRSDRYELWALQPVNFTKLHGIVGLFGQIHADEKMIPGQVKIIVSLIPKTHDRQTSSAFANFTGMLNTLGISKHHNSSDSTRWYDILRVVYKQCQLLLWTAIIFFCCSSWSTKFKRD